MLARYAAQELPGVSSVERVPQLPRLQVLRVGRRAKDGVPQPLRVSVEERCDAAPTVPVRRLPVVAAGRGGAWARGVWHQRALPPYQIVTPIVEVIGFLRVIE